LPAQAGVPTPKSYILRIQAIESFDSPELAPYRTLRYQVEHRQSGIFVAEGENAVQRLIASPLEIVSAVVPEHLLETYQPLLAARGADIPLYVAPKALLETLTGFPMYQGVMAVGKVPAPIALESLLERAPRPLLLVAADGISSAQNVGALTRNCAAFSTGGLIVDSRSCSPFLRRAVSSSAGTIFSVPIIELDNLPNALRELRTRGVRCIGAHPSATSNPISKASLVGNCCLVMGSEGPGISPETLAQCDELVSIPMPAHVDSLNVASASAVFLYEAVRQRTEGS
jgi:tRNA G18 (ribose-2'-O)-methylase SpoU